MNIQLIEKIISTSETCPIFSFENPLLDKNVAKALSRSFVKILKVTKQNSNMNNNMRHSVLEKIRRLCRPGPKDHINLDENFTQNIVDFYNEYLSCSTDQEFEGVAKNLDEFLIRTVFQFEICSKYKSKLNSEAAQAIINLNESNNNLSNLVKDVLHWDFQENRHSAVLNNLWNSNSLLSSVEGNIFNDICIKRKEELEQTLLEVCLNLVTIENVDIDSIMNSHSSLLRLIKICAISDKCFQMSCEILNHVFIKSNFNSCILDFITKFVASIKESCNNISFSTLYDSQVSHVVILLDLKLTDLPLNLQEPYVIKVIEELKCIQSQSDVTLIMLLSHFPQWFNILFK